MTSSQRFCLRWNNHQSNLLSVFDQLLHDESFVDVTLAVEGQLLKAHKMVLSACSPYFQALFVSHPDKHPIVILKDVPFADMRSLLDFMYRGEVSVDQDRLTAFLKVAESLRIKGLTEVNEERPDLPSIASSLLSNSQQTAPSLAAPPPPPSLHRIHLSQPSSTSSSPSNAKRSAPSPSNFSSYAGNNVCTLFGQKRKRGRPRKLSGSSDTPSAASPEQDLNTDSDNRNSTQSNLSDSPYAHGPPDLLEVNMTEHSQNSPSSFSEEQNVGSPEQICTPDISDDCCIKSEPGDDSLTAGTSFQDRKSPQIRDNSSSRSQSQTPTNQSERFPPDRCHWKEILKRLKKPEISIRVENDKNEESSGRRSGESASSKTGGGGGNNNSYYETFASGSGKGVGNSDSVWFTDSSQGSQYYMEVEGDDMDDDDDAIIKYEYEGTMRTSSMMANNSNSSPGNAAASVSGSGGASGAAHQSEQTKPLDKSSVRRYCVQVAEHLYQCTLCYKTYTHISNFSRHFLSAHHGLRQEIPCPVCFRIFTRRDNMLTHMKQVHRITVTRGLATSLIQKLSAANESGSNSTESQVNSN